MYVVNNLFFQSWFWWKVISSTNIFSHVNRDTKIPLVLWYRQVVFDAGQVVLYAGQAVLYAGQAVLYARQAVLYAGQVVLYARQVVLYAGQVEILKPVIHFSCFNHTHFKQEE